MKSAGLTDIRTIQAEREWLAATKPWPAEMDEWSHSRHSAAGNAVSADVQVGPPRRVRWVVGAESEVAGLVTSGGRNYYAGTLARDSFNGLRLWNRDLVQPGAQGPFQMKSLPATMPTPVAAGGTLFAVSQGKLLALDGARGETVREYPAAGQPQLLLHDRGLLMVADATSVKALDADSGSLRWTFSASAPRHLVSGDECVGFLQGDSRRGEPIEAVLLDRSTGGVRWKREDLTWAAGFTAVSTIAACWRTKSRRSTTKGPATPCTSSRRPMAS